ncbi:MAG: hypothetical protein KDA45_10940, partial [Planctomycetales bacterium]|nr:hypothetical protein [Planctomycetales bacterium]
QQGSRETQYTPHRLMWPSYWGTLLDGQVEVLQPEEVYEMIRRPLKVRRDFTEELAKVSLSLSQRKELLGEDRARVKDEQRTPEERQKVEAAEDEARQQQVEERLAAALTAVEEKYPGRQAVYISGGVGFARDGENKTQILTARQLGGAADPYAWPQAHNVRPARQALGAQGCSECHRDGAPFFEADLSPVALVPTQRATPLKAYSLQKVDRDRLKRWNQVFRGRDAFKWASFTVLTVTCVVLLSALVWNIGNLWRGEEQRLP